MGILEVLYKLATLDYIVLYKRSFPLRKGLTYERYMKLIDELNFSPYYIVFEERALFGYYDIEVLFDPLTIIPFSLFSNAIVLRKGKIRFSKDDGKVYLEAGSGGWFELLILLTLAILIYSAATVSNFLFPMLIIVFILAGLYYLIYKRDIRRFQVIENLASNPTKKTSS